MRERDDMVMEDLVDSEAELRDALIVTTADRDAYRILSHQAIHALHDLTRQRDRLREQHARLLDEYRSLRVQTMREWGGA